MPDESRQTSTSMNEQLHDLSRAIGRIEGKLDNLTTLRSRVESLEKLRVAIYTSLAAAGLSLADAATGILNAFKHP